MGVSDKSCCSLPGWLGWSLSIGALDHGGDALANADAHGRQSVSLARALKLVAEHRYQPRAAHAQRMTQRDSASVDVDLLRVKFELAHNLDRLARESLVELDEIHILHAD